MECYKNISKFRNFSLIFQNFEKKIQKLKNIEKIHMDSEKSMNSFETKKISYLIIY